MKLTSAAHAIVINQHHQMLVLHIGEHTAQPERSHTPDIPGGFIETGESERRGLIRELQEETGISVAENQLRLVYVETTPQPERDLIINKLIYLIVLDHTPEVHISWEHKSYEWVSVTEVDHLFGLESRHKKVIDYIVQQKLYEIPA